MFNFFFNSEHHNSSLELKIQLDNAISLIKLKNYSKKINLNYSQEPEDDDQKLSQNIATFQCRATDSFGSIVSKSAKFYALNVNLG
jgi:hypothetical protein